MNAQRFLVFVPIMDDVLILMDHIYATVILVSMVLTVKFMIHVDHHHVLIVEHVYQLELFHFGNVSVQHFSPVSCSTSNMFYELI